MGKESRRDQNRRRRLNNALKNLYDYARRRGDEDPRRTAEEAARRLHGDAPTAQRAPKATRTPAPAASTAGTEPAAAPAADSPAAGEAEAVPHRLEDRTKEQLYSRAQELDISGRSQMTKEELVDAIRAHQ